MIWVMLNETRGVNMQRWPALRRYPSSQTHSIRLSLEVYCRSTPKAGWGMVPEQKLTKYSLRASDISTSYTCQYLTSIPCAKGKWHIFTCLSEGSHSHVSLSRESRRLKAPFEFLDVLRSFVLTINDHPIPPFVEKVQHQNYYDLWIRDVKTTSHITNFSPRVVQRW